MCVQKRPISIESSGLNGLDGRVVCAMTRTPLDMSPIFGLAKLIDQIFRFSDVAHSDIKQVVSCFGRPASSDAHARTVRRLVSCVVTECNRLGLFGARWRCWSSALLVRIPSRRVFETSLEGLFSLSSLVCGVASYSTTAHYTSSDFACGLCGRCLLWHNEKQK